MKYVFVTGTRNTPRALTNAAREAIKRIAADADCICEGGAGGIDAVAFAVAAELQIDSYVMRARWRKQGRPGGPIRNGRMAQEARRLKDAGHDVTCHAFPGPDSSDTWDCVDEMKTLGIEVVIHTMGLHTQNQGERA